ncbi:MAG TPA: DUF1697 domain-containing protein [Gaiellaceae bacterium]|nr:DUF1697 domain-containing protein [Gaiellaceae bacterium]
MPAYVALLRGINVGGNSLIRMAELRECVAALGHDDVRTYIASGNVLFRSGERSAAKLDAQLERAIEERFGFPVRVVVRSAAEVARIVERVPARWRSSPELRVSVWFLLRDARARALSSRLTPKEGVDEVVAAPGAVIWAVRRDALTRTGIRLIGTPDYRLITSRNLNTAVKLAELLG